MGFSIEERAMKEKIENYKLNEKELDRLYKKFIARNKDIGKITSTYGLNAGGGGFSFASKVENAVVNKMSIKERISVLEDEVYKVNVSQRNTLSELESEVIDYIKNGFKMSHIARLMKKERKDIKTIRDRSIKKMAYYIDSNT